MSAPEWYSGSDKTGHVARGIEQVIERMDDQDADHEDVAQLDELLSLEAEPNWHAFLVGLIGTIHYDLDEIDQAQQMLEQSHTGYRPYLESFDGVLSVYCQTCFTLGSIHHDADRFQQAIPWFLRCLPYMHEVYDDVYLGAIYTQLAACMAASGRNEESTVLAEAAVFARHGDCESLEQLMVAYATAGDLGRATEVYELLEVHCRDHDHFERIRSFAREQLGEGGEIN